MDKTELDELRQQLLDKFNEYTTAINDYVVNQTLENAGRIKQIDSECKVLNAKYWKEIGL